MIQKKILLLVFILLISFFLHGCGSKNTLPLIPPEENNSGYIVINEGLYGQNNSSVTFYNIQKGRTTQNVYSSANNGNNLGDTANDIAICCHKGFIVVDNSKKIDVISTDNFKSVGIVDFSGYGNPRKIIIPDSLHAYVTTLNNSVVEFNPINLKVTRTFSVGLKPEGIVENSGKLFVANSGFGSGNSLSVIDTSTHAVISNIPVWQNPVTLLSYGQNVYAISIGKYDNLGLGAITKINSDLLSATDTITINHNPGKATLTDNSLLVINGDGVVKIDLSTFTIADSLFIKGVDVNPITKTIYSLYFDALNNRILLGNPKDYLQNGEIAVFDIQGEKLFKFEAGLNPGTINYILKNN